MNIGVLIVEDHPLMQEGLRTALARDSGFTVLGTADTGSAGLDMARELRPDIVLLDLHLPELSGIGVLKALREDVPEAKCIMVTASEQAQPLLDSVAAGAMGYLTKRSSGEEIRQAVITVHGGGSVISPALAGHLLREYSTARNGEGGISAKPLLTDREQEILRLVAEGHTDREIAETIYVSIRTVQNHLAHIRQKTGMHRRVELARWAAERAL
jgi:DNA-binding NarL/FixJ family response regulator